MDAALRTDWGDAFWARFYRDPETRIVDPEDLQLEGMWLGLTLKSRLEVDIDRAVDLGSGTGDFAEGLDRALQIRTRRIDLYSPDDQAERTDIARVELNHVDLIVCRDTLQYLEHTTAAALLTRIDASGARALYLRAPTQQDECTPDSDDAIARRSVVWHTMRLPHYVHLRFGVWIRRGVRVQLGAIE